MYVLSSQIRGKFAHKYSLILFANQKFILKPVCTPKCLIISNEREKIILFFIVISCRFTYALRSASCTVYRYIHKKFNPPVTSNWVYNCTTRSRSRNRKERSLGDYGKKSIDICFHSLQKSCLPRVAWYTCSQWLVLPDVTIFLVQTDAKAAPFCHITRPWRFSY